MRFGVVVFPGSNCDHDAYHALKHVLDSDSIFLWHKEEDLRKADVLIVPGGFSYGDYLRCGAIAKFSPIMESLRRHASEGKWILGICNGFQILQEAGLLPGVMLQNANLKFICKHVHLRVENNRTPFTSECSQNQILSLPVAHNEGQFYASAEELRDLEQNHQIVFRYVNQQGEAVPEANPNGSLSSIAGIINREGNVLGMMPHPERAVEKRLGSEDGLLLFRSIIHSIPAVKV